MVDRFVILNAHLRMRTYRTKYFRYSYFTTEDISTMGSVRRFEVSQLRADIGILCFTAGHE